MTIGKAAFVDRAQLLLARFARIAAPRELAPLLRVARAEHQELTRLGVAALHAERAMGLAREQARRAASDLDGSVAALADAFVLAGVGGRFSPLSAVGAPSPTTLARIGGFRKAEAVRGVLARVGTLACVPPSVRTATCACGAAASALVAAVEERDHAEQAWLRALGARDAAQSRLAATLRKLERRAQVAWEDEPTIVRDLFAGRRPARPRRSRVDAPATEAASTADVTAPATHARVAPPFVAPARSSFPRLVLVLPEHLFPTSPALPPSGGDAVVEPAKPPGLSTDTFEVV